jgi:hypothetical protein
MTIKGNTVRIYILIGLMISIIISMTIFNSSCVEEYTIEESESIARTFLEESPTYQFSGIRDTVELVDSEVKALANSWEFTYEFLSGQSGYGDRTGIDVSQETRTYEARITVWEHKVVRAVINEHWDELYLKFTNEPI